MGLPTILLAPTTTTFCPASEISSCSSSRTTPYGVHPSIHGILVQLPLPPQFQIGPVLGANADSHQRANEPVVASP